MNFPTVGLIIIGDEILSGRTQDKNTQHIAQTLGTIGADLKEVRVIPDDEAVIIDAVKTFSEKYTYVFTTGGIGPTHDDITTESVAKAFGREVILDESARLLLEEYYGQENLNEGRVKMAYVPENARLIENSVTIAPGFVVSNVYVMAGVPRIMQAMLEAIIPELETGAVVISHTVEVDCPESKIATLLGDVQSDFREVAIGSYPFMRGDDYSNVGTNIVLRSRNQELAAEAKQKLIVRLSKDSISFKDLEGGM